MTKKRTLKTRTSSPSDHWQFWKRTIRRQESGLEPGTNHTRRYTHRRGTGCGIRPQWAALPLSYPVTYVQLEYTTQVTNVSFSYTIYHQMSITWIIHGKGKTTLHPLTSQERKKKGGGGRETPRKGTLKTRTSSPSDHWQVWKQTIRRQESGLEPGIIHTERYTCIQFQCGCSPIELSCPLCSNGKHHTGHECQF